MFTKLQKNESNNQQYFGKVNNCNSIGDLAINKESTKDGAPWILPSPGTDKERIKRTARITQKQA